MKKLPKKTIKTALTTALLLTQTNIAYAGGGGSDVTWNGSTSNDITNASNWTSAVPTSSDTAIFNGPGSYAPDLLNSNSLEVGTIQFSANTTISVDDVTTGLSIDSDVRVADGVTGIFSIGSTNPGLLTIGGLAGSSTTETTTGIIQYNVQNGSQLNLTSGAINGATVTVDMTGGYNQFTVNTSSDISLSSIDSSVSTDTLDFSKVDGAINLTDTGNHTINGQLIDTSGNCTFAQDSTGGTGTLYLTNYYNNSNSYNGTISIKSGTINIPNLGALGGSNRFTYLQGGTTGSILQWSGNDDGTYGGTISLDSDSPNTGTLDLNGFNITLGTKSGIASSDSNSILNIGSIAGGTLTFKYETTFKKFTSGSINVIGDTTIQDVSSIATQGIPNVNINLEDKGSTLHFASQTPYYSNQIIGTGSVIIDSQSTLSFSSVNNFYSGPTYIGTTTPGQIVINHNTGNQSPYSSYILANLDGTSLTLENDAHLIIGSLAGGGSVGGNVAMANNSSLNLGRDNTNTLFSGLFIGNHNTQLIKVGYGTFSISENNENL